MHPIQTRPFDAFIPHAVTKLNSFQLKHTLSRYTSEIVATCGLGIDGHSFNTNEPELVRMGKMIFEPSLARGLTLLAVFLAPAVAKLLRIR